MAQETTDDPDLKPDELFEKFLEKKTAELDEKRRKTVTRLARSSFYGGTVFKILYPEDAAAPPDIVYEDESPFARLRFNIEDIKLSEVHVREFTHDNFDRFKHYRTLVRVLGL